MMTKKRMILALFACVVGAACLFFTGIYIGHKYGVAAGGFSASMAELQVNYDHMADDLENGTCDTVRDAINRQLSMLSRYRGKNDLILPEHTYYADLMLANMRLMLVEEHLGNTAQSKEHLTAAMEACSHRGWKDCSESKIKQAADASKRRRPSACLGLKGNNY